MRLWLALFLPLLLCLASCADSEKAVPVPVQGEFLRPARFDRIGHYVAMTRPNAGMYFVRDVMPKLEQGLWRWTGKNPTFRFDVPRTEGLSFSMDFFLSEVAFRDTGPVTISYSVNDWLLAAEHYAVPGEHHFRRPVPVSFLPDDGETVVSAEIDKTWRFRIDGRPAEVGFILMRAGFEQ